ncbi:MAG: CCA tRNA nucleotidyltransferase [Clostridia bacterium]|nr:CCA tRNA nucleotidyltransferase [Clostridia bacterium]
MQLCENANIVISKLEENGFSADIVGGSVRDFLLLKEPNDYDVTTDATPAEMRRVFSDFKILDTGIAHGTLTVLVNGEPYEVTTYRLDGEYTDGRHPDSVSFAKNISEDLSRRDFTVNAMAYNPRRGLTDLFGGREDLSARIIRAVGDPHRRFSEDALRIIRALRFASTLDFSIEDGTATAIKTTRGLIEKVSRERIYAEWKKLIAGVGAYRILSEFSAVIEVFIPELSGMKMPREENFNAAAPEIRELMLFAVNGVSASDYAAAMTRLRTDNKHRKYGEAVLSGAVLDASSELALKLLLINYGSEITEGIVDLKVALGEVSDSVREELAEILASNFPYRLSDLAVTGNDLLYAGLSGSEIGAELKRLLLMVAEGQVKNTKEELILAVTKTR